MDCLAKRSLGLLNLFKIKFFYITFGLFFVFGCGGSPDSQVLAPQSPNSSRTQSFPTNWSLSDSLPLSGRTNPFNLNNVDFADFKAQGQIHAQVYPVAVTGVLLPERPLKYVLDNDTWNPVKGILNEVFKSFVGVDDFGGLLSWVGLNEYPKDLSTLDFKVPMLDATSDHRLGYSRIMRGQTKLFTMSCATCHSDQLFGQTVFGMTKRFPRANEFFIQGGKALNYYSPFIFKTYTKATRDEMYWLDRSIANLKSVGHKMPLALGLDTSLAQVALSLKRREPNPWADKSPHYERRPRANAILDHDPGDSKPAVWWNVKYKNRWLSDGSVVSGNPIYTNLLWNEIGRGTDLRELATWLNDNDQTIKELTTAVFSVEAPRIEKFFDANQIIKERALRGEVLFNQTCSKCHGVYLKNWSQPEFKDQAWREQIKTYQVIYPQPTPVVDVGTDPYRYLSMKSLETLNDLQISKDNSILIQAQKGYVPPPLVGIWARWPYMHNNSVPSLCALLMPSSERPKAYYAVTPNDPSRDFDFDCNGYPEMDQRQWRDPDKIYKADQKGLLNTGHDEDIFVINGRNVLSAQDRRDLIQFLQTL